MTRVTADMLEKWDKRYIWHPFTQMKEWCAGSITVIERGEGNYLIDTRGRRYLDGVSSLWCNVHGHRVKTIDNAVKRQLDHIAHSTFLGLSHTPAIKLAKELIAIAPKGITRVFYSDSGSASVEAALKIAYQYWQNKGFRKKQKFLKLAHAYHGDTVGSVSVGGIDLFHEVYGPLLFKTFKAGSLAEIEKILKKHHKEIAAVVMEPLMQGAAGMLKQPKGNLAKIRALTRKYGVLLIVDEVATGFGRTGKMFACEHERVTPDILCVAKGITGGYLPLSATLVTEEIYRAFLADYGKFKHFFHGHTYSANPLACAAALASLEIFKKERTLQKLKAKIRILSDALASMKKLKAVREVRQVGFMAGIELAPYALSEKMGFRVAAAARAKGVMIRPLGNVAVLMPPLSITHEELKKLCRVVEASIREVTE